MEDISRHISVLSEGGSNALVIELQENEKLIPYCCKIMESNKIPGLLQMNHQMTDNVITLRYDLNGKVRLREFMLQHHLPYQQGIRLLRNLTESLMHLEEYFLSIDMCYLHPDQIYVGDGLTTSLPCIPVEQDGYAAMGLKQFYEKLISEYFATADCSDYDRIFKWVYNASMFDLNTFHKMFLEEEPKTGKASAAPMPAQPERPVQKPVQPVAAPVQEKHVPPVKTEENSHELTELLQSKMPGVRALYNGAEKIPAPKAEKKTPEKSGGGLSFEIPGLERKAAPAPKAEKTPAKEKKGFAFFGGKAEKQERNQDSPEKKMEIPFGNKLPKPNAKPSAKKVQEEEPWDSGTILVNGHSVPESIPAPAQPPMSEHEPKAYLVHKGNNIPINETPFMVGKYNTTCKLHYAIYDNNKVSRSHATFLSKDGKYYIRDNQSRNGTTLNGHALLPLKPEQLKDGDEIMLYDERIVFHMV